MKFKEIKPGMVIHCPTEDDARALYKYCGIKFHPYTLGTYKDDTCYHVCGIDKIQSIGYGSSKYYLNHGFEITEFSGLIEPDEQIVEVNKMVDNSPMTAVEILDWFRNADVGLMEGLFNSWDSMEYILGQYSSEEILNKITAYEAAKKAPKPVEVEWVNVVKIIDYNTEKCVQKTVLADGGGRIPTERALKEYRAHHEGDYYAVVERRCRVKEGE